MKAGIRVLGVAVSALLLAGAGVFYTMAGDPGERHYHHCMDLVRRIQQVSSGISLEVARVRMNPFADFDPLAAFIPRMERLKVELDESARLLPGAPERLLETVDRYVDAVEAKERYVEQFKTSYSVVRNSTRYLPRAAANATRRAEEAGHESLARVIPIVVNSMNSYLATPTDLVKERLKGVAWELRGAGVGQRPELAEAMETLATHTEVLLSRHAPMVALFHGATSDDLTKLGIQLSRDLELQLSSASAQAAYYRHGLVAVSVLLVMFWVVLVVLVVQRRRRASAPPPEMDRSTTEPPSPSGPDTREALASTASLVLNAQSAVHYDVLVRRAGDVLLSMVQKILARIDSLHQGRGRIDRALPDAAPMQEPGDDRDLDGEVDASARIAATLRRDVDDIADIARRLASHTALPDGAARRTMVDVNACMDEVVAATGADRAAVVSRRYGKVPRISASSIELRALLAQVLMNSVQALEALKGRKGTIKISTSATGTELTIAILDNGPGIPPEKQKVVFNPFHSSRDGAMGIGLTVAADLVRRYEGTIDLRSLPDRGTLTRIALPVRVGPADQPSPEPPPEREDGGRSPARAGTHVEARRRAGLVDTS